MNHEKNSEVRPIRNPCSDGFLSRRETVTRAVDDMSFEAYPGETLGMVMNNGKIEEIGPAEDIYNHPRREYTRKLIAAIPEGGLEDKPMLQILLKR